jgi:hypothetical protein
MIGAKLLSFRSEPLLKRWWRPVLALAIAGCALYYAVDLSDWQGRGDLPSGYAVRMTCEKDPESYLWSGGCDRIATDIALKGKPTFLQLYEAFVITHHSAIPSPGLVRRYARHCEPGFDVRKLIKGTRFILSPEAFEHVCSGAFAHAVMNQIDDRDRALLAIEREGLTWQALVAGTLANLSEPLVILGAAFVVLALLLL